MKKVLFLPTHETSWCEMLLLAMELKDKTEVCFLIDTPLMLGNIASLESKRIKYFVTTDESLDNNASVKLPFVYGLKKLLKKISIITKLIKWIRYKYLTSNKFIKKEYSDTYTKFDSKLVLLRKLFDVEAFDVCVVYGDRHISCCELPLLAVCRERKIPAIITPISLAAVGETLTHNMTQRYQVRRFPEIFNKFPNQIWMNPKTGESFFFYPVGIMLALSELKILPDNPWALGGSASTNILVDGEYDKQRLVKSGCPIDKIIITGHRSHDKMLSLLINKETLKGDLVTKYSFDVKKKLLVIVLPQWVEDCLLERVFAWDEINRLCEALSNQA